MLGMRSDGFQGVGSVLGSVGSVLCRQDDEFMGRAKIQTSVVAQRGHIEVGSHSQHNSILKLLHFLMKINIFIMVKQLVFLVPLG